MKNYSLSMIRFISLIMIITCHILQGLGLEAAFWVNLGVQVFFFLSGFLYGNKNIDSIEKYYLARLYKILFPYLVFIIIVLILEVVYLNSNYYYLKVIANLLGFQGTYGTLATTSHTWFVTYILFCYLITPILQRIFTSDVKSNERKLIIVSVFLILIYIFKITNLNTVWIINFILGYYFAKLNCLARRRFLIIMIILSLTTLPFKLMYSYNIFVIDTLYNIFLPCKKLICDFNHVFIGSAIFIILYNIFNKISIKKNLILDSSDKYSYYIYLTHQLFILNSFSILFLTKYNIVNICLIFTCSIISGIILHYICLFISRVFNVIFKRKNIVKNKSSI